MVASLDIYAYTKPFSFLGGSFWRCWTVMNSVMIGQKHIQMCLITKQFAVSLDICQKTFDADLSF